MRPIIALLLCAGSAFAEPTTMRLKIRPSTGELVATDRPCGDVIRQRLWRTLFESPRVEIIDDAMRGATRSSPGDPFIGEWIFSDRTYMIAVTQPRTRQQRYVRMSFTAIYPTGDAKCSERWVGLGEQW